MARVTYKSASAAQRLRIINDDIMQLLAELNCVIDSGDYTLCKLLKLKALADDLKNKTARLVE